jgi:hypothetical protein
MKEAHPVDRWPFGILRVVFIAYFLISVIFAAPQANTRSAFTQPITTGIMALFLVRVAIAYFRKDRSRDWVVYLGLLILIPIAAYVYAQLCIPYYEHY